MADIPAASRQSWMNSPVSFECKVARVELFANARANNEGVTWRVSYLEAEFPHKDVDGIGRVGLLPTARLLVTKRRTRGQVLVVGQALVRRSLIDDYSAESIIDGFVEEMWDVGRRTLNMLSAQTDSPDLELPLKAPPVELTRTNLPNPLPVEDGG